MGRALLIVLDGFGIGSHSPFNAIENADMPFYRDLIARYPHSQLITHGQAVGLPDGIMGNSEVGHTTMGAGRIIYQDLTRISQAIRDGGFERNPALLGALRACVPSGASGVAAGRLHLLGLLSDGGVHSHIEHLEALLTLAQSQGVPQSWVHVFTDGRDTPPNSGRAYVERLLRHPAMLSGQAKIASIGGRYYGMDRDQRWERVERAYDVLTGASAAVDAPPLAVIDQAYAQPTTDEFIVPVLLTAEGAIRDGDAVIFANFRSDRARELTRALSSGATFEGFARKRTPRLAAFVTLTQYEASQSAQVAFGPQDLSHLLGEWLEAHGKTQFRIAETEKYAHVTFFFNGGREQAYTGEDRVLIPSPKDVPTYDLKPEMSARAVAEELERRLLLKKYDFLLVNFANADMVGHTGNYEAAVRAMQTLDQCLARVVGAAHRSGYDVLITADHGNAEEMRDHDGHLHTQHTLNPVPAIWIAPGSAVAPRTARRALHDGTLADLYPTLCRLLDLPEPPGLSGKSLLPTGAPS